MRKIIDSFIFYNELDMLEFRFTELNDIVDHFVLVEATKTFSGNPKELLFEKNKNRFEKWSNKIVHIVVDDMPEGLPIYPVKASRGGQQKGPVWDREVHQRNCITRGVDKLKPSLDDIIIISDCDEIPDITMLQNFKNRGLKGARRPIQDFYYYNLNCKGKIGNSRCRIMDYATFKKATPEKHTKTQYQTVKPGGWHFSYFGSEEFIINKIKHFSHQEFNNPTNTDKEVIKDRILNCADLFDRPSRGKNNGGPHGFYFQSVATNNYLPNNYAMLLKLQNQNTIENS